jgi:pimeloyl-ACP methyl ester carboxylesterase
VLDGRREYKEKIAFEKQDAGPAVILVDGALGYRSFGPLSHLAELLAPRFTVFTYDRRGRCESGNGEPYALEREVEDINALVEVAWPLFMAFLWAPAWPLKPPCG